jgi:hypothetical protein
MTIQLSMFGGKYDGKQQADLFVAPVSTTAPRSLPPIDPETLPMQGTGGLTFDGEAAFEEPEAHQPAAALVISFGSVEIHRQACCPACGDVLPPKAKACPNCYTKIQKGGK